jgi:hypothetical protein
MPSICPELEHMLKAWEEIEYRMYLFSVAHEACIECLQQPYEDSLDFVCSKLAVVEAA